MTYSSDQLADYLAGLVPTRPEPLIDMEAYAEANNFPIIGPAAGNYCYLIARAIGAKRVFELGSGYGYSTAWFARAVAANGGGEVFHVVWDDELSRLARTYMQALGYDGIVRYRVGEAVQTLAATDGPFDLIFNDIDKEGYPASLPVIEEKLRAGGVLIVDNVLWSGRVFDDRNQSKSTVAIREFTRAIVASDSWIVTIVPIRDGLLVAYRN